MTLTDNALAQARELAAQISSNQTDSQVPISEITRLGTEISSRAHLAIIIAILQNEALAQLDEAPRYSLGLARCAYELARVRRDTYIEAGPSLTLAIVSNRIGEFRVALDLCLSAATEFEKRGNMELAARCYFEAAWAQTFLGHLNEALSDAERARRLDASALMNARCDWIRARVLRDQGDYPEAKKLFENSSAVFESAHMLLDAARCNRELAHTYLRSERADTISLLQDVRNKFEFANCPLDEVLCDWLTALSMREANQYRAALDLLYQTRARLDLLGTRFFLAWCDIDIGINLGRLNRFEESLEAAHRARNYFLSHDVPVEVSACDINLGVTLDTLNQYDEALVYFQEAADLALKEGRQVRAGRIFNNIGSIYQKQGLYAKAMDYHQRALQIYSDKGLESLVGSALVNLASACRRLGQYGEAIKHLNCAREIFLKRNLLIVLAECEYNLADGYIALYELSDANIHIQPARDIYAENKLESLVAACDRLLAHLANEKGERQRALSLLSASRATFLKHHQIVDAALCDLTEGELRVEWNEIEPARQAFLRAQTILSPGFPDQAWRVESGLGNCARSEGEPAVAIRHFLNAVRIIAQSRSTLVTEQLSNDYFSSRQSVYDNALKIALDLDMAESALEVVEASKARVFTSLLQNRQWNIPIDGNDPAVAQLLTHEKELRYELDALRTQATVTPPKDREEALRADTQAQISEAALEELNALSRAYESVVTRLRLYSSGLAGVSSPAPFSLDHFRKLTCGQLGNDWAALDYYLSYDTLSCIVVQPTCVSVWSRKLSAYDRAILDRCVSQEHDLREYVYNGTLRGEPAPSPSISYLSHMYHLLVPEWLDAETWIVVPHGALHALPFHALKNDDDFVILHHALVYAPSLQALQFLLSVEQMDSLQSLAVGLSDFGDHMRTLHYARAEADRFRSVFGKRAEVLWDDRATRKEIFARNKSGVLHNYGLIHFATHAILDRFAPHRSRVILHDEALSLLDIMELRLNARLVTLSACETALGQAGRGDELLGLARAFFYAGARAILASLWRVEDRSTAELIGRFYRHLAEGKNNAVALRLAQIEMIQAEYSPFQWASLGLMGRP